MFWLNLSQDEQTCIFLIALKLNFVRTNNLINDKIDILKI